MTDIQERLEHYEAQDRERRKLANGKIRQFGGRG